MFVGLFIVVSGLENAVLTADIISAVGRLHLESVGGQPTKNSKYVPITPSQIADEIINAAKAGAAVARVHVRDPDTGAPSSRLDLYEETIDRVRSSSVDIVLNVTTGPGAGSSKACSRPAGPL
jgi:uncharacterized protein (DUF849 family)